MCHAHLSAADAYKLCSLAADFRVTQTVNGVEGPHAAGQERQKFERWIAARRRGRAGARALELPLPDSVNAIVPALLAGNTVLLKHSRSDARSAPSAHALAAERGFRAAARRTCTAPCTTWRGWSRPARFARGLHRLGRGRARGRARGARALPAGRPRARRQGSRPTCAPTPTSRTRSRTWSTARSSTRASAAAASSASTCTSALYDDFVARRVELTYAVRARQSARAGDHARPAGPHARAPSSCARTPPRRCAQGARALIDERRFPAEQAGHAVPRAAGAGGVDHGMRVMTRGDVRAGRRHHEGRRATTRPCELMNDSRYGLTAAIWTRDPDAAWPSATGSRPAPCS